VRKPGTVRTARNSGGLADWQRSGHAGHGTRFGVPLPGIEAYRQAQGERQACAGQGMSAFLHVYDT
jgi:hypothetical protein